MSDTLERVPTTISVTRIVAEDGGNATDESLTEEIEVHKFATTPALVRFEYPLKLSQNYQTVGVTVGVTLPCYAEEVERALDRASELVVARLAVELPKLRKTLARLGARN